MVDTILKVRQAETLLRFYVNSYRELIRREISKFLWNVDVRLEEDFSVVIKPIISTFRYSSEDLFNTLCQLRRNMKWQRRRDKIHYLLKLIGVRIEYRLDMSNAIARKIFGSPPKRPQDISPPYYSRWEEMRKAQISESAGAMKSLTKCQ